VQKGDNRHMWIMGVDMGTSGCRAVVFDEEWCVRAEAYCEYSMYFLGDGLLELDAELVWQGICTVIKAVNKKVESPIGALAVSAIGDVIIPLGADGKQVRRSIVDFDLRGAEEIDMFMDIFGVEKFFELTGMPPLYIGSLAKILWIKEHEPQNYKKVIRWSTYEDFIVERMGLFPTVSYGEAARTMLFDIRKKTWSSEILEAASIDQSKLPHVISSAVILGEMPEKTAKELGFEKSVLIASGGHDMICAAVGAGLDERKPKVAVDIAGTIEGVVATFKDVNTSRTMLEHALPCYPSYSGYVTFSVNLTAGCVVRWFRDRIALDLYQYCEENHLNVYEYIQSKVDVKEPGKLIFLPHFSGSGTPCFDPKALGALYGLTLDTTREDIARAMIESLCYEVKSHIEAFQNAGIKVESLICVGGGNRIEKQLQLKSNITGLKIIKGGVAESSALGAASYAAVAVGQIEHPADAYAAMKDRVKEFSPITMDLFRNKYRQYKKFSRMIHEYENVR